MNRRHFLAAATLITLARVTGLGEFRSLWREPRLRGAVLQVLDKEDNIMTTIPLEKNGDYYVSATTTVERTGEFGRFDFVSSEARFPAPLNMSSHFAMSGDLIHVSPIKMELLA